MTTSVAHTLRMAAIAQDFDDADAAADSRAEQRKTLAELGIMREALKQTRAALAEANSQLTDARDTLAEKQREIEALQEQVCALMGAEAA